MKLLKHILCLALVAMQSLDAKTTAVPAQKQEPAPAQPIKKISYKNLLEKVRGKLGTVIGTDGRLTPSFVKEITDSQLHLDFIQALLEAGANLHLPLSGDLSKDIIARNRINQQIREIMPSLEQKIVPEKPIIIIPEKIAVIQPPKIAETKPETELTHGAYERAINKATELLANPTNKNALLSIIETKPNIRNPKVQVVLGLAKAVQNQFPALQPHVIRDAIATAISYDNDLKFIIQNEKEYAWFQNLFDEKNWVPAVQPQQKQPKMKQEENLYEKALKYAKKVVASNVNALKVGMEDKLELNNPIVQGILKIPQRVRFYFEDVPLADIPSIVIQAISEFPALSQLVKQNQEWLKKTFEPINWAE